jgi:hypothetical protein
MKKISISGSSISLLAVVIILIVVIIEKQRGDEFKAFQRTFSDYTPTADTPEPANDIEALRLISPENHMPDVYESFIHHPERLKFYQRQLKAIDYIGARQIKAAIPQLILYLDYATSGAAAAFKDYAHGPETDRAKKVWPAFGALLEIPGSGEVVRDYCLDPVHPFRYRVAALDALYFIDPGLFDVSLQALKAEGVNELNSYDPAHVSFWGMQGSEDAQ